MKYVFSFILILLALGVQAQQKLSPAARLFEKELQTYLDSESGQILEISQRFITNYDLYRQNGKWYVGALILMKEANLSDLLEEQGVVVNTELDKIYSVRIPLEKFNEVIALDEVVYLEAGSQLSPDLERSRYSVRADSVHAGAGDLGMPYKGKGVIVAIIDWGFDYTHPVFFDTSGQLRISRAWDQNKNSGPAPDGFSFGTEYVGQSELLAAKEDTLYVFGPGSHGTHVGGIAGGGGAGTKFYGVAPEAELIFISLKRDDPSFIDAITYVSRYADAVQKPFVVNMSFGGHTDAHDGSTLRNIALDLLAGQGKVFVASAGNNGGNLFHIREDFQTRDTLFTEITFNSGLDDYWGETVSAWAEPGKPFSVSLLLVNNQNQMLYESPWYGTQDYLNIDDTLYSENGDLLLIRLVTENSNTLNKKPNMLLEAHKLGNKKLIMRVVGSGKTHFWHVNRLNNRVTNWGQRFGSAYPNAVAGDDEYGIGGPQAISKEVITVASHRGEFPSPSGTGENGGQLSPYTSKGPTADERRKPDISGPGQDVCSSVNSFDPNPGQIEETVTFNGKDYHFVKYSGTSMSGPAVAGVIALMLQANPNLTAREVKDILRITARQDAYTGVIATESHLLWGWGKVNALAAVRMAELKLHNQLPGEMALAWYPNPAIQKQIQVEAEQDLTLRVFDMQGRLVWSGRVEEGSQTVDLSAFISGMYILQWTGAIGEGRDKLIIP